MKTFNFPFRNSKETFDSIFFTAYIFFILFWFLCVLFFPWFSSSRNYHFDSLEADTETFILILQKDVISTPLFYLNLPFHSQPLERTILAVNFVITQATTHLALYSQPTSTLLSTTFKITLLQLALVAQTLQKTQPSLWQLLHSVAPS